MWTVSALLCLATVSPVRGENVAAGLPFQFSPDPNYSGCTDTNDHLQLTEGQVYTNSGAFWVQTGTVGWAATNPVTMVVDLGTNQPISGISYHTAAGRAGVLWPASIGIYVSPDDTAARYYYVGDLVGLSPSPPSDNNGGGATQILFTFLATNLATHGRFVKLVVRPAGFYAFTFVDEVEVLKGPPEWADLPYEHWVVEDNLALNKSYTYYPDPNYPLCTDAGDLTQLTDGFVYGGKGSLWTAPGAVGWQNVTNPAIIRIDLGSNQPIRGASFHTAAGIAGVQWPKEILVLASPDDDQATYYYAGNLRELSAAPPDDGMGLSGTNNLFTFRTTNLVTHGRFVMFIVRRRGTFSFVDEVEVCRGPAEYLEQSAGEIAVTNASVQDLEQLLRDVETTQGARQRLRLDLAAVSNDWAGFSEPWIQEEISNISTSIAAQWFKQSWDFRSTMPLNDLHQRIFALRAALWRTNGWSDLVVWQSGRWDYLGPADPPQAGGASLEVVMMKNERRSAAFNISNAGTSTQEVSLLVTGLPGGTNPAYVTVHAVPFTDTSPLVPVAAALPVASIEEDGYQVVIPPGCTRQVWLSFHPVNVEAGDVTGSVVVRAGAWEEEVPLRFKLFDLVFPDRVSLHLGGWDYTDPVETRGVSLSNRSAIVDFLQSSFVDTAWAKSSTLSTGEYDSAGNMILQPDDEAFEEWMDLWPDARNYLVYMAFSSRFAGFDVGTPAFSNALHAWTSWWGTRMRDAGIGPERFGLLLVDEPGNSAAEQRIVDYARVIRSAEPSLRIWENPLRHGDALPEMIELCDILSPKREHLIGNDPVILDFYRDQQEAGRELWLYSCEIPARTMDPYAYHRLMGWFCWQWGARGASFWSFTDTFYSWNEYLLAYGDGIPFFLDERIVMDGKHMAAVREGIQDYEYMQMLKTRLDLLDRAGVEDAAVDAGRSLLTNAADRVLAGITNLVMLQWQTDKDRSVADTVRVEVLDALSELKALTPTFRITAILSGPDGGSVDPSDVVVEFGDTRSFAVTAPLYAHIADIKTNGFTIGGTFGGSTTNYIWSDVTATGCLTVVFQENKTSTGTPERWLAEHGLTNLGFEAESLLDKDEDGVPNWQEYLSDTDPNDELSYFKTLAAEMPGDGWLEIVFADSMTSRVYLIYETTNLVNGTWEQRTNRYGTGGRLAIELTPGGAEGYYRGAVKLP